MAHIDLAALPEVGSEAPHGSVSRLAHEIEHLLDAIKALGREDLSEDAVTFLCFEAQGRLWQIRETPGTRTLQAWTPEQIEELENERTALKAS